MLWRSYGMRLKREGFGVCLHCVECLCVVQLESWKCVKVVWWNNRNVLQIWVLINSLRHRLWLSAPKFHSVFVFSSTCQSDTVVNGRHLSHCKKRHFARIRSAKWLKKSFSTVRILCFVFTSLKTSLSLTQLVGQNKTFEVVIVDFKKKKKPDSCMWMIL